jgi:sugar/nucleoside kinase (ribokinase family)
MKYIAIGDNVVDRYVDRHIMFPGGNAVNFAALVRELGCESAYLGVVADDREGDLVIKSLHKLGVDVSACYRMEGLNTERCDVKIVDGERKFIGTNSDDKEQRVQLLNAESLAFISGFDYIHSSCYSGLENDFHKLGNIRSFKTFDFSDENDYRKSEYMEKICPYINLALFSRNAADENDMENIRQSCRKFGTRYVLFTMGADGQVFFDGDARYAGKAKIIKHGVADTMGAGDSFFAAFLTSLSSAGLSRTGVLTASDIQQSLAVAADFAAQNCLREGAFGFATAY